MSNGLPIIRSRIHWIPMTSTINLYKSMVLSGNFEYLLMYKFSQDHLEIFLVLLDVILEPTTTQVSSCHFQAFHCSSGYPSHFWKCFSFRFHRLLCTTFFSSEFWEIENDFKVSGAQLRKKPTKLIQVYSQ